MAVLVDLSRSTSAIDSFSDEDTTARIGPDLRREIQQGEVRQGRRNRC